MVGATIDGRVRARVTLVDIARVQLDLALERCSELRQRIEAVYETDIRDLSAR